MKIQKFLIVFVLSIFTLGATSNAIISNSYKQGIYSIEEITESEATARLISKNEIVNLSIITKDGYLKFFKRLVIYDEPVNLGYIKNGDKIVVVGSGEIVIYPLK